MCFPRRKRIKISAHKLVPIDHFVSNLASILSLPVSQTNSESSADVTFCQTMSSALVSNPLCPPLSFLNCSFLVSHFRSFPVSSTSHLHFFLRFFLWFLLLSLFFHVPWPETWQTTNLQISMFLSLSLSLSLSLCVFVFVCLSLSVGDVQKTKKKKEHFAGGKLEVIVSVSAYRGYRGLSC